MRSNFLVDTCWARTASCGISEGRLRVDRFRAGVSAIFCRLFLLVTNRGKMCKESGTHAPYSAGFVDLQRYSTSGKWL